VHTRTVCIRLQHKVNFVAAVACCDLLLQVASTCQDHIAVIVACMLLLLLSQVGTHYAVSSA
jgi:hypothetical protein